METAEVMMLNVALVVPAGTAIPAGTLAVLLSLAKLTRAPPAGAGLSSVTVPVEVLPPNTLPGFTSTDNKYASGVRVNGA